MPSEIASIPLVQSPTVRDMLRHPAAIKQLSSVASPLIDPGRMIRTITMSFAKNKVLAEATPMSFLGALMTSASLGLMPNTVLGEAYLVPYKNGKASKAAGRPVYDIEFQIGWKGLVKLARRSGGLVSIHADVATKREWDDGLFQFEYGSNQRLVHQALYPDDEPLFCYAYARLQDGEAFIVWPYSKVLAHRDRFSQAYNSAKRMAKDAKNQWMLDDTPWVKHERAMACKTLIRQLCPRLDLTAEAEGALQVDEAGRLAFQKFAMTEGLTPGALPDVIEDGEEPDEDETEAADEPDPAKDQAKEKAKPAAKEKGKPAAQAAEPQKSPAKGKPAAKAPAPAEDKPADPAVKSGGAEAKKGEAQPKDDLFEEGEPDSAVPSDLQVWADLANSIIGEIEQSAGDANAISAILAVYDGQLKDMQTQYPDEYQRVDDAAEAALARK